MPNGVIKRLGLPYNLSYDFALELGYVWRKRSDMTLSKPKRMVHFT